MDEKPLTVIRWAQSERLEPARAIQDHFLEKDTRITLVEAQKLVVKYMKNKEETVVRPTA